MTPADPEDLIAWLDRVSAELGDDSATQIPSEVETAVRAAMVEAFERGKKEKVGCSHLDAPYNRLLKELEDLKQIHSIVLETVLNRDFRIEELASQVRSLEAELKGLRERDSVPKGQQCH